MIPERDESVAPDEVPGVGEQCVTLVVLLALTATTTALAFLGMSAWAHAAVALGIAAGKAVLVALVFMHLARAERLLRVTALAGSLWLALLFLFVLVDVALRAGPR